MADSKQLHILKRLTTHLQGITPANGYDYDLSASVFRGRALFGANDPVPMVSILEAPKPDVGLVAGENKIERIEEWLLLLQGWTEDDKENPTDPAYGLKAAVEKRLSEIIAVNPSTGTPAVPGIYRLNVNGQALIGDLSIGPGVVRPPDAQVSSKAYFFLPLRVSLPTNVSNPFVT